MIIKSFTADSAAEALKRVRQEMGGDAIVLKTLQVTDSLDRDRVEITACLEKPTVGQSSVLLADRPEETGPVQKLTGNSRLAPTATDNIGQVGSEADIRLRLDAMDVKLDRLSSEQLQSRPEVDMAEPLRTVCDRMRDADFTEDFIAATIGMAAARGDIDTDFTTSARETLVESLSRLMIPDMQFQPGDCLAFFGPAGAGKSSVLAKLAATLIGREKQKVTLLTLDNCKMAAFDEVHGYAEVLGAGVVDPLALEAFKEPAADEITLIDSPGLPTGKEKIRMLAEKIDRIGPNYRFAVFSALMRSSDITRYASLIEPLKPTHIIATMFDLTDRHGSAVTAAEFIGRNIAFVTDSPGGIGDAKAPDPDNLVRQLLDAEAYLE